MKNSEALSALLLTCVGPAALAGVVSFTSVGGTNVIGGPGSPDLQTLTVPGVKGTVVDVDISLNGLSHAFPDDLHLGVTGAADAALDPMANAAGGGGAGPFVNLDLTFDDEAASALPDSTSTSSASYRASRYGDVRTFGSPAPAFDHTGDLSRFDGLNANGTWSLFGLDDGRPDPGPLQAFTVTIATADAAIPEPASLASVGIALIGLGLTLGRKAR